MAGDRRVAPIVTSLIAVAVVAFLAVLVLASSGDTDEASSPLLGQPAPTVRSSTIDDTEFDLSRRKGSWVLLNFFNSTCVPCIQEHPELVKFSEEQASRPDGVEIYSIINDDSDSAVRAFFDAQGGTWPKVRDTDGSIAVAFGVAKVPETWIIDPNGYVRLRILGSITQQFLNERFAELRSANGETPDAVTTTTVGG